MSVCIVGSVKMETGDEVTICECCQLYLDMKCSGGSCEAIKILDALGFKAADNEMGGIGCIGIMGKGIKQFRSQLKVKLVKI